MGFEAGWKSTNGLTRDYKRNSTYEKLSQHKSEYSPPSMLLHSDFRGLVFADYEEALGNSNTYSKYKKSRAGSSNFVELQTSMMTNAVRKKINTSIKEIFPVPSSSVPPKVSSMLGRYTNGRSRVTQ